MGMAETPRNGRNTMGMAGIPWETARDRLNLQEPRTNSNRVAVRLGRSLLVE